VSTGTDPAPRPRILTRSFGALLVAQACFGYAFSSFFLLPKFLVTELSAGPVEIGWVAAAHGISIVLLMPLIGGIVDRRGRRAFLTGGALVMAIACFSLPMVEEVGGLLYFLRALQGLAFAMAFVGGATLAVDHAPPERLAQAIGIFGLTFLSMNAVAPAAVETIEALAGWPAAFRVAGASALLCALLSLRLADRRDHADGSAPAPGVIAFALRPRQLRTSLVIGLSGAALGALFNFYQPYALELGIRDLRSFFIAYAIAAVVVRVGFGEVIDRIGRRRVSLACLGAYIVILAAMTQLRPGTLPLFGGAMGLTHGLFYPAFNAVAAEGVAPNERGKMMGLFQGSWQVGFSLAQVGLGALAERAGYPAAFLAGSAFAASSFLALGASPDGRERSEVRGG
jgi:MFS family permease